MDDFQAEAWRQLSANPESMFVRQENRNGREIVRVAIADRMVAQGCVDCHNAHADSPKTDWKIGDVRGVLEIGTVIDDQLAAGQDLSNKLLIAALLGGLLIIALSTIVARRIAGPLMRLAKVFQQLAAGEQRLDIPGLERKDEIGQIARASDSFNQAARAWAREQELQTEAEARGQEEQRQQVLRIANLLEESVMSVVDQVVTSTSETLTSSERLDRLALENTEGCQEVQGASNEASDHMRSVSSATDELNSSIKNVADQMRESSQEVRRAAGEAERTTERVSGLAEASRRIGAVVDMINDIAEQTNLLALNATIEAARAGDAGKGFAVVAGEVKNLASQTARATDDIASQVTSMQEATDEAVSAIGAIGETFTKIDEIVGEMSGSIERQEDATRGIAHSVQETTLRTDKVFSNIERMSLSANESGEEARRSLEVSQSLKSSAEDLNREVVEFIQQLRETDAGNRRTVIRQEVDRSAVLSDGVCSETARLVDLTTTGARVRSTHPATEGQTITVKIQSVGTIEAVVVRKEDDFMGLRFNEGQNCEGAIEAILPLPSIGQAAA